MAVLTESTMVTLVSTTVMPCLLMPLFNQVSGKNCHLPILAVTVIPSLLLIVVVVGSWRDHTQPFLSSIPALLKFKRWQLDLKGGFLRSFLVVSNFLYHLHDHQDT